MISIGAGGGSIAWLDPAATRGAVRRAQGPIPGRRATARAATSRRTRTRNSCSGASQRPLPRRPHAARRGARGGGAADADRRAARPQLEEAAEGVLKIANANMVQAIRLVTIERGFDPREFSLSPSGARAAPRRRSCARATDAGGDRPPSPVSPWRSGCSSSTRWTTSPGHTSGARTRSISRRRASTPRWSDASPTASCARVSRAMSRGRPVGRHPLHRAAARGDRSRRDHRRASQTPSRDSTTSTYASTAIRIRSCRSRRHHPRGGGQRTKPELGSVTHARARSARR